MYYFYFNKKTNRAFLRIKQFLVLFYNKKWDIANQILS